MVDVQRGFSPSLTVAKLSKISGTVARLCSMPYKNTKKERRTMLAAWQVVARLSLLYVEFKKTYFLLQRQIDAAFVVHPQSVYAVHAEPFAQDFTDFLHFSCSFLFCYPSCIPFSQSPVRFCRALPQGGLGGLFFHIMDVAFSRRRGDRSCG